MILTHVSSSELLNMLERYEIAPTVKVFAAIDEDLYAIYQCSASANGEHVAFSLDAYVCPDCQEQHGEVPQLVYQDFADQAQRGLQHNQRPAGGVFVIYEHTLYPISYVALAWHDEDDSSDNDEAYLILQVDYCPERYKGEEDA